MITSEPSGIFSPVEVIGNEHRSSWINVPEFNIYFEMEGRIQVKEVKKEGEDEVEEEVKEISAQTKASPDTKDCTEMQPKSTAIGGWGK